MVCCPTLSLFTITQRWKAKENHYEMLCVVPLSVTESRLLCQWFAVQREAVPLKWAVCCPPRHMPEITKHMINTIICDLISWMKQVLWDEGAEPLLDKKKEEKTVTLTCSTHSQCQMLKPVDLANEYKLTGFRNHILIWGSKQGSQREMTEISFCASVRVDNLF